MKKTYITTDKKYTYEIFVNDLYNLLREFCFLTNEIIGYSVLKKPIYALRFGKGSKKIIITASHHGCEWLTSMLLMAILEEHCNRYKSENKKIWEEKSIYFVPMLNPDGVNLSIRGITDDLPENIKNNILNIVKDGNVKDIWQSNILGVDLNHNYDASFEKGRKIQIKEGIVSPSYTKYSGTSPESEPETKALVSFTKRIKPDIVIAYHSQGEEIFYKYQGKCSDNAYEIAQKISETLGYELVLADGLTDCTGYKDWVIEKFNIPAYTIEIGKGKNPLPISQFEKIYNDNKKIIDIL